MLIDVYMDGSSPIGDLRRCGALSRNGYTPTSFKLSLRDLVIMMADRGISVTHTTILRWVQRYLPEFEKRWRRYARPVGGSWRMDETYIKVRGQWVYRAVDKAGQKVDFFLSRNQDVNAAKSFLRSAMTNT